MSGVNRNILAEQAATGGDIVAAFQPAAIREEDGRASGEKYTGKASK